MKYQANPVIVDAFKITYVERMADHVPGHYLLTLEDGKRVVVDPKMTARHDPPNPGDVYVVQEDGYAYLNPPDVFQRKYSPKMEVKPAKELTGTPEEIAEAIAYVKECFPGTPQEVAEREVQAYGAKAILDTKAKHRQQAEALNQEANNPAPPPPPVHPEPPALPKIPDPVIEEAPIVPDPPAGS